MAERTPSRASGWTPPALFVLALVAVCAPVSAQQQGQGPEQMFQKMCAGCHDDDAEGDGPHHSEHLPSPSNLTLIRDTPAMAYSIVQHGIPGTAMPAFPQMSRADFARVWGWLEGLPPDTALQWSHPWTIDAEDVPPELGAAIYTTACAGCHGPEGRGDGHWAEHPQVWPKPTNFHARNSELGRLYWYISHGRTGTMMAPQDRKFPAAARWALARHIAQLYDPGSSATIATAGEIPSLSNPYDASAEEVVAEGHDLFDLYCVACHGAEGKGSFLAPMLIDRVWDYGDGGDADVFTVVRHGIPGRLMPGHAPLTEDQIWRVITYLRHRGGQPYPRLAEGGGEHHHH